jgi:hypothetical protein
MTTRRQPPALTKADVESDIKAPIDALGQPGGALPAEAFLTKMSK